MSCFGGRACSEKARMILGAFAQGGPCTCGTRPRMCARSNDPLSEQRQRLADRLLRTSADIPQAGRHLVNQDLGVRERLDFSVGSLSRRPGSEPCEVTCTACHYPLCAKRPSSTQRYPTRRCRSHRTGRSA